MNEDDPRQPFDFCPKCPRRSICNIIIYGDDCNECPWLYKARPWETAE